MIKRLKIKNFKSFKDIDVELGNFNVVIGANASGKSNFVSAIKFLRDIARKNLKGAVEAQKGLQYLPNLNIGISENLNFKFTTSEIPYAYSHLESDVDAFGLDIKKQTYSFKLELLKDLEYNVTEDKALFEVDYFEYNYRQLAKHGVKEIVNGPISLNLEYINKNGKLEIIQSPEEIKDLSFFQGAKMEPNELLLSVSPIYIFSSLVYCFRDIFISDFDYKLLQESAPFSEKKELEENASNLANVLNKLFNNEETKRKLINLVKYTLGFVEDVDVGQYLAGALIFKLKETYTKEPVPQFLLSEGTINILALIIVLYFQGNPLVIFEEFTRAIHPHLISRIVNIIKEVSKKKQIIVTTHNPEVLRYVDVNEILLVSRDKEGFSTVSRPADKDEVKVFLKNNIGIEDLFAKDLLKN